MPQISFLRPTDQPTNTLRLINELSSQLASCGYSDLRIVVAFAKLGPMNRLSKAIASWVDAGKTLRAVIGIDEQGTSKQALEYALAHFTETHIAHVGTALLNPTFHPKLYLFSGPQKAVAYVGSNNLTVGGTETNLETFTKLELTLPADSQILADLDGLWNDALQVSIPLTPTVLAQFHDAGLLADETRQRNTTPRSALQTHWPMPLLSQFPPIHLVPASPLPRPPANRHTPVQPSAPTLLPITPTTPFVGAGELVIQINPHHNGEVFLSKIAITQNPAFFGWPFSGVESVLKLTPIPREN